MSINVLAIIPGFIPSTVLNVVKPMIRLQEEEKVCFKTALSIFCTLKQIDWADVVIFCRNIEPAELKFLYYAKGKSKKIIYDLDDNFFAIDGSTEEGKYYKDPSRITTLVKFIECSDLVRVYSKSLYDDIYIYNKNVVQINSYFDFSLIRGCVVSEKSKIKITYATSRGKNDVLKSIIVDDIKKISQKYLDEVEFHIFGSELPVSYNNIFTYPFEYDYSRFIKKFYRLGIDIGLAPLKNDVFHRSKTNNKYREYGACNIAGIYSNVDVYSNCVMNGKNGLLVDNSPGAWYDAMEKLIQDSCLRAEIQQNANNDIQKNYLLESFTEKLFEHVLLVLAETSKLEKIYDASSPVGKHLLNEPEEYFNNKEHELTYDLISKYDLIKDKLNRFSLQKLYVLIHMIIKLAKINYFGKY